MDENVTAIIPAYNEQDNILDTINAVRNIKGITETIVADDGSTDGTYMICKSIDEIAYVRNSVNKGKGHAIKSALPYVSNEYVILIDADLKQSAGELQKLVDERHGHDDAMFVAVYPKALRKGGFGLVKGLSRYSLQMLAKKSSESVLSGQRLMATTFLKSVDLPDHFGMEFKITLDALKRDMEIVDIPVQIRHRETGRNLRGFIHRGKQFTNILNVVIRELM